MKEKQSKSCLIPKSTAPPSLSEPADPNLSIREPAVSGIFYPDDPIELQSLIKMFFSSVKETRQKENKGSISRKVKAATPKAIIVPHAGYIYSGIVAAKAYFLLKDSNLNRVILVGPAHNIFVNYLAADEHAIWQSPLGEVKLFNPGFKTCSLAHKKEHSLEVQIPFLQSVLKDFEILPLLIGDSDPVECAKEIRQLLDKDTLLVISSDLSHYHDYKTATKMDKETINKILKLDKESLLSSEACGILPILTLIELARQLNWKPALLAYKNSGDTAGDKDAVVGYAAFAFY